MTRPIFRVEDTAESFTHSVSFGGGEVTITMTQIDPVSSLEQMTTIRWEVGKKWWSDASITLGGDTLVSATLLP